MLGGGVRVGNVTAGSKIRAGSWPTECSPQRATFRRRSAQACWAPTRSSTAQLHAHRPFRLIAVVVAETWTDGADRLPWAQCGVLALRAAAALGLRGRGKVR